MARLVPVPFLSKQVQPWLDVGWKAWIEAPELESWVYVKRRGLEEPQAGEALLLSQQEIPWHSPINGKGFQLPRAAAWLAREPCSCPYGYGGHSFPAHPIPAWLDALWQEVSRDLPWMDEPCLPTGANMNLYRSGTESVGWHADNEPLFDAVQHDATIVSLSLGATREFQMRLGKTGKPATIRLGHGDLLIMTGRVQKHYQHRVPATAKPESSARVNITWRWVKRHDPRGCCMSQPQAAQS